MTAMLDRREWLPTNTVYTSPHSDGFCHQIAQAGTVLLTQVGSGLHGVTVDADDDRDEMGVCIEPPDIALGVWGRPFDLYEYRTQPMGTRSGAGDLDLTVFGLRKYCRLVAAGNPTKLLPLFAPEHELVRCNWVGRDLRARRDMFVTRHAGARFLGYLDRQRDRFAGRLSQRTNRPELVEVHGYDTKFAYHALRIALQGVELMTTGAITLPMTDENRGWLLAVRRGEFDRKYIDHRLDRLRADLVESIERSNLADQPNAAVIDNWVAATYRTWWSEQSL